LDKNIYRFHFLCGYFAFIKHPKNRLEQNYGESIHNKRRAAFLPFGGAFYKPRTAWRETLMEELRFRPESNWCKRWLCPVTGNRKLQIYTL